MTHWESGRPRPQTRRSRAQVFASLIADEDVRAPSKELLDTIDDRTKGQGILELVSFGG